VWSPSIRDRSHYGVYDNDGAVWNLKNDAMRAVRQLVTASIVKQRHIATYIVADRCLPPHRTRTNFAIVPGSTVTGKAA